MDSKNTEQKVFILTETTKEAKIKTLVQYLSSAPLYRLMVLGLWLGVGVMQIIEHGASLKNIVKLKK